MIPPLQATSSSPPIEKLGNGAEGAINEGFEAFAAAGEGLLRSQADVNAADELGRVDVAALLLKGGGQQPAGANAEDREGKMALLEGREADMGLMLEAGGDIAEMNQEGGAALEEALCAGHGEATFLVKEGASCPTSNPASRNGRMALHQAARKGDEDAVRRLVEDEGAEINATTSRKMTALHEAARNGHEGVVRMLLGGVGGQRARINARTKTGMTALHMAARNGQERVVMLLLDGAMGERADINATDNSGRTALHEASQHGHDRIVTLLLQGLGGAGAHSNATDKCGRTAPDDGHVHEQAVKLLEKAGGRAGSEVKLPLDQRLCVPLFKTIAS